MKTLSTVLGLVLFTVYAQAGTQINVTRNNFEASYQHASCKLSNKNNFFDKKSLKKLSKKGYILLTAEQTPSGGFNLSTDVDAQTYMIAKSLTTMSSSSSTNGKSSSELTTTYGLDDVIGGILTVSVSIPGSMAMDFTPYVEIVGTGKKSSDVSKDMVLAYADLMPACAVTPK